MEKQVNINPENVFEKDVSSPDQRSLSQTPTHCLSHKLECVSISNLNKANLCQKDPDIAQECAYRRSEQSRLKYRRLKQRLTSLTYRHEQFSMGKEATSCNKPRLMKLSIELERQVNNQVKDYSSIDNTLKEIFKVLEQKRENDLHVLRQSRFLPSLMEFFKKLVSSHRTQYRESIKILDIATNILHIFSTVSINREFLILTNRLQTLLSVLNWSFSKKQEILNSRFLMNLLSTATLLLDHRFQSESNSIIQDTIEFAMYSYLMRRIRLLLQSEITEQGIVNEPLVRAVLRFCSSLLTNLDPRTDNRPINEMNLNISYNSIFTIQSTLIYLALFIGQVLFEKDGTSKQNFLSQSQLAILLHVIEIFSTCSKMSLALVQRIAIANHQLWLCIRHIVIYCNEHYSKSKDIRDLLDLTLILIGYLSFENIEIQSKSHDCGILHEICNLPTNFIVDKRCVQVLMPTLCCLVYKNDVNFRFVFEEMSSLHMKKFLKCELQQLPEDKSAVLVRKFSQSSLNSENTQCSGVAFEQDSSPKQSLRLRFPAELWRPLYQSLDKIE